MFTARSSNVEVAIRARPLRHDEGHSGWDVENNTLIERENTDTNFTFDRVYGPTSSTKDCYDTSIKNSIVSHVANGYNGCIFAYGQTSSGKTFTMLGPAMQSGQTFQEGAPLSSDGGVTEMALRDLFELLEKVEKPKGYKIRVFLEMLEIYNENLRDLLQTDRDTAPTLRILEDEHGVYVRGATRRPIVSAADALNAMLHEASTRVTAATNMNHESSRSHCLIRVIVEKTITVAPESPATTTPSTSSPGVVAEASQSDDDASGSPLVSSKVMERKIISSLNLVDLAGSERVSKTGAVGIRLTEGANINKSLACLTTVIQKLSEPRKPGHSWHIPFRDSKLTHLLKTAIGGNSFTSVFCCMTLSGMQTDESRSTLQFAQRAKKIRNEVQVNEVADAKTRARTLELEVKRLRRVLVANDIYLWSKMLKIKYLEESGGSGQSRSQMNANADLTQELVQENAALRSELQDALTAIAAMGGTVSGGTLQGGESMHIDPLAGMGGGLANEELRMKAELLESDLVEAESIKATLTIQVGELEDMLDEMEAESQMREKAKEETITQLRDQVRAFEQERSSVSAEISSLRTGMQQMQEQRQQEQATMLSQARGDELSEQFTELQVKYSQLQYEHNTLFDMYSKGEQERLQKESVLQELLQDAETRCVAIKNDMSALQGHTWKFINLANTVVGCQEQPNVEQNPRQQQVDHAFRVLNDLVSRRGVEKNLLANSTSMSKVFGGGYGGEGGEDKNSTTTLGAEPSEEFSIGRNFRRGNGGGGNDLSNDPEVLKRKIRELENTILQKDNHRDVIIDTKLKRMQELVMRLHTANSTLQLEVDRVVDENKRLHELVARDGKLSAIVKADGLERASAELIKTSSQFAATPNLPFNHN